MKVVIINGSAQSGKDQFVKYCEKANKGKVLNTSMVEGVKNLAFIAGWDGVKTPESRKFLSDLKDLLDGYNDFSMQNVIERVNSWKVLLDNPDDLKDYIVFIMAREPHDIEDLVAYFDASTLLIRRTVAESVKPSNHADADVFKYKYDYEIDNNGTLEELEAKAAEFVKEILKNGTDY